MSAERTPSTHDVRAAYIEAEVEYRGVTYEKAGAEFDRWLNLVRAAHWVEGMAYAASHLDVVGRDTPPWEANPHGVR